MSNGASLPLPADSALDIPAAIQSDGDKNTMFKIFTPIATTPKVMPGPAENATNYCKAGF